MSVKQPKPWYCSRELIDEYKHKASQGDSLRMLKLVKLIKSIIVNIGIIIVSVYGLYLGGDPTVIAPIAILVLAAHNGVDYSEIQAIKQAILETHGSDDRG